MLKVALISLGLACGYLLFQVIASENLLIIPNVVGPIILLLACLWGMHRLMNNTHLALFTPMPWFLGACAAYFGFAPLVFSFGSADSVSYIDNLYPVNGDSLLRTNLLNVIGIAFIVIGYLLGKLIPVRKINIQVRDFNHTEMIRLTLFFLCTGLAVKYVFAFPYYMGWISWTLPGGIQWLSSFSKIAIILWNSTSSACTNKYS